MVGDGAEPLIPTYFPDLEGEGGSAGVAPELIRLLVNDRIWALPLNWALPLKLFQKMIQFSTATIPFTDLMLYLE